MEVKDRIRQVREHFGLSQALFAQRIDKSPGLISLIETDRGNVSDDTIKSICSAFPINESWLRTGEGEMTGKAPVDRENIGRRIRQIRKDNKLSQDKFAKKVGYCHQQICGIENGHTNPSRELLTKICSLFDINVDWLMTGIGEKHAEEVKVDAEMVAWLNDHPEKIRIIDGWMRSLSRDAKNEKAVS